MSKQCNQVVIEDKLFFTGENVNEVFAFTRYAGRLGNDVIVIFRDRTTQILTPGNWLVKYADDDLGVLGTNAYQRFFV